MKINTYRCDECDKVKGEANHWWVVGPPFTRKTKTALSISSWGQVALACKGIVHLCGQACVLKVVDRFLSTGTMETPQPKESA